MVVVSQGPACPAATAGGDCNLLERSIGCYPRSVRFFVTIWTNTSTLWLDARAYRIGSVTICSRPGVLGRDNSSHRGQGLDRPDGDGLAPPPSSCTCRCRRPGSIRSRSTSPSPNARCCPQRLIDALAERVLAFQGVTTPPRSRSTGDSPRSDLDRLLGRIAAHEPSPCPGLAA